MTYVQVVLRSFAFAQPIILFSCLFDAHKGAPLQGVQTSITAILPTRRSQTRSSDSSWHSGQERYPRRLCEMVQLLDLPNEILEMIFHGIVHDLDVCPTSTIHSDEAVKLREALNLRLIHPRTLSLVDPAIFGEIDCEVNAATFGDSDAHLLRLLWDEPKLAGLVKQMVVRLEHDLDQHEANLVDELIQLLGATAEGLEMLRLVGKH